LEIPVANVPKDISKQQVAEDVKNRREVELYSYIGNDVVEICFHF
jgi:hypothetical protein